MTKLENVAQYLPIAELVELKNNPRQISKKNFEILKESIQNNPEFFEAHPIIASDRTGENVVIAGNQRLRACKALGMSEAPVVVLHGLSEEQEREIIIRSNVENGEWDMDALANEWDVEELASWGVDIPDTKVYDDIIEIASQGTVKEYDEDTNYNLKNLVRDKVNPDITKAIDDAVSKGEVRPEIEEVLRTRANQCTIFNFDEIIKFYRSGDASEAEKDLLRRLYLVFITPKEAFESGLLELDRLSGKIYDRKLTENGGSFDDEEN